LRLVHVRMGLVNAAVPVIDRSVGAGTRLRGSDKACLISK